MVGSLVAMASASCWEEALAARSLARFWTMLWLKLPSVMIGSLVAMASASCCEDALLERSLVRFGSEEHTSSLETISASLTDVSDGLADAIATREPTITE